MNGYALYLPLLLLVLVLPSTGANQVTPDWQKAHAKIRLWLPKLDEQFCRQDRYESLTKLLMKTLKEDDKVVCSFYVTSDGLINRPNIAKSSGSKKADQAVLRLVNSAAPLVKPPCRLARMQAVIIEFRKQGRIVESMGSIGLINPEHSGDELLSE